MKKLLAILILTWGSLCAQDCVIPINLNAAGNSTTAYNNKASGCAYWQVYYFSTGFSAVSVQFESAPDTGTSPGAFSIFAGTVTTGVNPTTATVQGSATFSGGNTTVVYPWVRVHLVSATGTGIITGRIIGSRTTSESNLATIQGRGLDKFFGKIIPVVDANWFWWNQGGATYSVESNGAIVMTVPLLQGGGFFNARCTQILSAPYTVTVGLIIGPGADNDGQGIALADLVSAGVGACPGTQGDCQIQTLAYANSLSVQRFIYSAGLLNGSFGSASLVSACSHCGDTTSVSSPIQWFRVSDDGVNRTWSQSSDGVNFYQVTQTIVANNAFITPTAVCWIIQGSSNLYQNSGEMISYNVTQP